MKTKSLFLIFIASFFMWSCEQDTIQEDATSSGEVTEKQGIEKKITIWGAEATVYDFGDYYLFHNDVRLDKADVDAMNEGPQLRGAAKSSGRWTNNTIPYAISPDLQSFKMTIEYILGEYNRRIPHIQFVPKTPYEANYLSFDSTPTEHFINWIGMKGSKQTIYLNPNKFDPNSQSAYRTITHLAGHALGLFDEESRTDRDNYIKFLTPYHSQKYNTSEIGFDYGPFDYYSIMLSDVIVDGVVTMTKANGETLIPQGMTLSSWDVNTLIAMYRK